MTTDSLLHQPARSSADPPHPYLPSWVDRLTCWVEKLPGPYWQAYLTVTLLLVAAVTAIKWRDGAYPVGTVLPFQVVAVATVFYYLGLIHYLDRAALTTLARFRPALDLHDAGVDEIAYRLTTLPARTVLVVTGLGLVYAVLDLLAIRQGWSVPDLPLFTSLLSTALEIPLLFLGAVMNLVFVYHTIHQLRMIHRIYARHTRIDLFDLSPIYAFSRLTARTAIGWIVVAYSWVATNPGTTSDRVTLAVTAVIVLLGLAAFFLPLLGIHRLLQEEKVRSLAAVGRRLKASMAEMHHRVDEQRYDELAPVIQSNTSLREDLTFLEKIPTWPWQPDTLRSVLTAVVLPIALWFATRLLERFVQF